MARTKNTTSICNYCKNCVGRCSWSGSLIPVDGWDAEEKVYNLHENKKGVTYKVKWCPQYEEIEKKDDDEWKKRAKHKYSLKG